MWTKLSPWVRGIAGGLTGDVVMNLDKQEKPTQTVLEQAEVLSAEWAA